MIASNSSIVAKVGNFLIESLDEKQIEHLARKTGFVQKKSKITGVIFALIMTLEIRQTKSTSLNELSTKLGLQGISISKQGIDNRFNEAAVVFMKQLTDRVLMMKLQREQVLDSAKQFNRIMIKDSTVFQLPESCAVKYPGSGGGASKAGIKIQYEYDLKNKGGLNLQTHSSIVPDYLHSLKNIQPQDLCLEDLGYITLDHLNQVEEKQAYFLTRLKYDVSIFVKKDDQYQPLDIDQLARNMKPGQMMDKLVYLGRKQKIPIRMILEGVPKQVADQKRRKLKTDTQNKRKGLSKGRLSFCNVNAFITNADHLLLPMALIRSIYSLRWQVEIIFKSWKSIFNLDKVQFMKLHRFECLNYGTLIQIIICTNLFNYYKTALWNGKKIEISELKSMKYLLSILGMIKFYLQSNAKNKLNHLLKDTIETLANKCKKERKKGRQTPLMILNKIP
jgi:hypothetical protein